MSLTASHPALAPLCAGVAAVESACPSGLGVRCSGPGRLEWTGTPGSNLTIARYGLELAWLIGIPELSAPAAAVLAARAAGCFAACPGVPAGDAPDHPVFGELAGHGAPLSTMQAAAQLLADTHDGGDALSAWDVECIEALWRIAMPVELLLASGGDDRLTLDPMTGLNRYGCSPWPRTDVISFGSCTASSLSVAAFAAAEQARRELAAATLQSAPSVALANSSDAIGAALLDYFQVADLAEAVLAASGTDAALVVIGLLAAEQPGDHLTSVLMAPAETGSGVPDAVRGRHFAARAATGCTVGKGEPIEGLGLGPKLVTVAVRTAAGAPRTAEAIASDCEAAIRAGIAGGRVVLHAIDGSKTGLTAPDRAACRRLADTYGGALDIVIDACQGRIEPALIRWYLEQGFPVLVTGSKFFTAPGFCGAVLFPRARLHRITRDGRLPPGLAPYARLEGGFGSRRCPGLVLRWRAALHEMRVFGELPSDVVRQRLTRIDAALHDLMRRDDRMVLVDAPRPGGMGWSGQRSVFTVALKRGFFSEGGNWAEGAGWLDTAHLRRLYETLNAEMGCQMGQPVELGSAASGGLRLAISAAQVVADSDHANELSTVLHRLGSLLDRGVSDAAEAPLRRAQLTG